MNYILIYIFTLCALLIIDFLWLVFSSRELYNKNIGHLLSDKPKLSSALIFYLIYTFGILILVILPNIGTQDLARTLLHGALLGVLAYGTYDLTNLATLKGWPILLTIIDILWGAVLTTVISGIGFFIASKLIT